VARINNGAGGSQRHRQESPPRFAKGEDERINQAACDACARANERGLREFAGANLAHFKAPHSVTFVKELPKTATGKIQKYILRAQRPAIAPQ
jgi:acyl-CoA synthetase (AMP-forming)/AMP-acid ligase II